MNRILSSVSTYNKHYKPAHIHNVDILAPWTVVIREPTITFMAHKVLNLFSIHWFCLEWYATLFTALISSKEGIILCRTIWDHISKLLSIPEHTRSPPVFSGLRVARPLVFCVIFCRSLFVALSFCDWPLCCLPFFDLRLLTTPLVFSIVFLENDIY